MGKRIISQRRGHGGTPYKSPSHRHAAKPGYPREGKLGVVEDIIHAPGRSAPLAAVRMENNRVIYSIASEGMYVGQEIRFDGSVMEPGNVARLADIPEGTLVYNIEGRPGDGGRFVRSGGGYSVVVSRGMKIVVQMPSGQFKAFSPDCRATIGKCAGGGRTDKPILRRALSTTTSGAEPSAGRWSAVWP